MSKILCILLFVLCATANVKAQKPSTNKLLFGVAYYDEYMPYDRLDKDIEMMKDAGINVVRIAESTWVQWSHRKVCLIFRILTEC